MVRSMTLVFLVLAVGIGSIVVVQASINSELRGIVGDPWRTALISTTVSTICLFVASLAVKGTAWPSSGEAGAISWWMWTGGVLGAIYVAAASILVARLGSAVLFALVISGQFVTSVVMDHFGVIGLDRQEITPGRAAGVLLLIAGVVLIRRF